jgi:bifunctional DNase/RNase
VIRVVITELKTATYFAEIVLRQSEREIPVSSRPSDAVAVAVRTGAPLFVADDLMESEGIMLAVDEEDDGDADGDDDGANPDELVGEFRNFLDSIRPEDFSS